MSPSKKKLSAKVTKTISVAAIFKRRDKKTNFRMLAPRSKRTSSPIKRDAHATTLSSVKSTSSPRSAAKKGTERGAVDVNDNYRKQLYRTTSLKISKTLETLLASLYESTLQTSIPNSGPGNISASPVKFSVPARYERLAVQLYQPISQFTLRLQHTNSEGDSIRFTQTLETRMLHYKQLITSHTETVTKLQNDWEATVREIWKLGVEYLGEEAMQDLLFTEHPHPLNGPSPILPSSSSSSSSQSPSTDAESTLFVPEHGTSPPVKKKSRAAKQRLVALFGESLPQAKNEKEREEQTSRAQAQKGASAAPALRALISQRPGRYRTDNTARAARNGTARLIEELEGEIDELGREEIDALVGMQREQRAYWNKKSAQLASVLREE